MIAPGQEDATQACFTRVSLKFQSLSFLIVVVQPQEMRVFVHLLSGEVFPLMVCPTIHTIEYVKRMVEDSKRGGVAGDQFDILHHHEGEDRVLGGDADERVRTLEELGIREDEANI